MHPNRLIIQWNCRSFSTNSPILKQQVATLRPLALLLQETRGVCKIPNYNTYMTPAIVHVGANAVEKIEGQAAILVRKDCKAVQYRWDLDCNRHREVVVVKVDPPGSRPVLLVSVYYRPYGSDRYSDTYDWITHIFSLLRFDGPVIVGGDFNARSPLWGYTKTDVRGSLLEQALEFSPLDLRNEPNVATRIGLHCTQSDTTPDLTLCTPGAIRSWDVADITWGSDHIPILIQINAKKVRVRKRYAITSWPLFRDSFHTSPDPSLSDFIEALQQARGHAVDEIESTVEVERPDTYMISLMRKAHRLTHRYRTGGKTHRDLMKLKKHYRCINEHQKQLQNERWYRLCERLGQEKSLSHLWAIFRSLSGKAKTKLPVVDALLLKDTPATVELEIMTTFFPHATQDKSRLRTLPVITVASPQESLDCPFTLAELQIAIMQGKPRSAPGHDGVTWQELRNLPTIGHEALLSLINQSWTTGIVSDHLKTTILHPIPKPGKDSSKIENLRPISLTPTICKLTERMINNRLQFHLENTSWFHPAQTGFRPNLGTQDYLWLLRRVLNRKSRKHCPDYLLALDMRKAFDNVNQEGILRELALAFPSQKAQNWIRNFLEHRPIRLNHKGYQTWSPSTFYLDRGVPQGSILGPILFNLAMNRIARTLEQDTSARFAIYADDIVVWTEAADYPDHMIMQAELQSAVLSLEKSLSDFSLHLSAQKTEFLSVDGRTATNPAFQIPLQIGDSTIQSKNGTIRLLGIQVGSCNSPNAWIRQLRSTWRPTLHLITRMSNKYGGVTQRTCLTLGRAIGLGRLTYGFPAYEFSTRHVKDLQILYRSLVRAVTGLPRHTPITTLEQALPLPPLNILIEETQARHRHRLELTHQGYKLQKWDQLDSKSDLDTLPSLLPPWERPAVGIIRKRPIPRIRHEAREQLISKLSAERLQDELDIFTDAAVMGNEAGVAWRCPDLPLLNGSNRVFNHFGLVEEAELLGIFGALRRLQEQEPQLTAHSTTRFRIITDSHVALQELNKSYSRNGVANQILSLIKTLQKKNLEIRLAWTPGHSTSAVGNQEAHDAARESLQSLSPPTDPHSHEEQPSNTWHQQRRQLHTESRRRLHDASPPGFLSLISGLSRSAEIFANKAHANVAYTPDILRKWHFPNVTWSAFCPFCDTDTIPNLCHLIWRCPAFPKGRDTLIQKFTPPSSEQDHLDLLRSDPSALECVANYAIVSGLFKAV